MARLSDGELLVKLRAIWHRVRSAEARLTVCDRSYDDGAELTLAGVEVGDVVCPACWEAERDGQ